MELRRVVRVGVVEAAAEWIDLERRWLQRLYFSPWVI